MPTEYLGSTYIKCIVFTPRYNPIENKYDTNIQRYSGDVPNRGVVPEGNRGLIVPIEESSYLSITTKDFDYVGYAEYSEPFENIFDDIYI